MTLRTELSQHPETIQEFDIAAEARYYDGLELMAAGRTGAGIYLVGYAAEMLLKCAYFLLTGASPGDPVAPRLVPARSRGRFLVPGVPDEQFHSLRFWSLLLLNERRWRNRPVPDLLGAQFCQRARRLYQNWWIGIRYRRDLSVPRHAETVYDDVSWLRSRFVFLWR